MRCIYIIMLYVFSLNYCNAQVLDGYTDKFSYRHGETIQFYINGQPHCSYPLPCYFDLKTCDNSFGYRIYGFNNTTFQSPQTNEPWKNGYDYNGNGYQVSY
jgi:hypothetical protein